MTESLIISENIYVERRVSPGFIRIKNGFIEAVGGPGDGLPDNVPVTDLGGAMILPGLWDSHVHLLLTGISLGWIDLGECTSIAGVQEQLARGADDSDAPIVGAKCDDSQLIERRMPDMNDLDAVSADRPIVINRIDSHSMVLNRAAYDFYAVDPKWEGAQFDERGEPTGRVVAQANEKVREKMFRAMTPEFKASAYRRAAELAQSCGCTDLCALEGGELFGALEGGELSGTEDAQLLMGLRDELPIDFVIYNQYPYVAGAKAMGLRQIGGCILVDGSIGSRTAAVSIPYADDPDNRGELYLAREFLYGFAREAADYDMQLALHAIGDRAVKLVLDAYAQVGDRAGDLRFRVEHAEVIDDEDIRRAADMGVILSMQPAFEYFWGGVGRMYEARLGERYLTTNRIRPIIEAGAVVAGGSDSNITPPDPLLGIHSAVNHPIPENAVSLKTAIRMFTEDAAYSCFAEKEKSKIAPGFRANLTILEENLFDVKPEGIKDVRVVGTVVGGEIARS
ncbi:MAG: amidohydrolase [bacterium]|nr:amidohydrolase [bacterium]